LKFWFGVERANLHMRDFAVGILGIAIVCLALVLWWYSSKKVAPSLKRYWDSFRNTAAWVGGLLIVWFGARFQFVEVFGTYFAALLVVLAGLVVVLWRVKQMRTKGATNVKDLSSLEEKMKYLPKAEAEELKKKLEEAGGKVTLK
jgi:hypothetical protein